MTSNEPIVIVGGGIVGTSIAYHLRNERDVLLLEQNDLLGGGTTSESIAQLGLHYPSPRSFRQYSHDHYWSLVEDETISYVQNGSIDVRSGPEGEAELERIKEDLEALGHNSKYLEPEDLEEYDVHIPDCAQALYIPNEGYLDPSEIITHWADEARSAGVQIQNGIKVTDILTSDGTVEGIKTTEGMFDAGAVVNAAGPWAPELNDLVDISMPLRHNHGPILVFETNENISLPTTSFPSKHYFREEGTNRIFAGRQGRRYEDAERLSPDDARSIPQSFYLEIEELIRSSFPKLIDAPIINEWLGMRTITPDKLPIVGESSVTNFYFACGFSGKGVTLAPAIGNYLAEQLTLTSSQEVDQISPTRFQ